MVVFKTNPCVQVSGIWRCTSAAGAARAIDARMAFKESDSHLYLSCSRSFGDPDLKANSDRPILSNQPDLGCHKLAVDDLFVVLACDGVWDVLADQVQYETQSFAQLRCSEKFVLLIPGGH